MNIDNQEALEYITEKYPHIAKSLVLFWGTSMFQEYTAKILTDTRDGTRAGFPFETLQMLFKLIGEHRKKYPETYDHYEYGIWSIFEKGM